MKKLCALLLLLGFPFLLSGCGVGVAENTHQPSIHWRIDVTGKYLYDDNVRQIVTVQAKDKTDAIISLFEKSVENGNPIWTKTLRCPGYIGLNGLGKTKEGDNKTPIGDFGIITAFGIKKNPGTALPYIEATPDIYCCADAECYNRMINITEHPHECEGEHLVDYSPEYNYGIFIDYNAECEYGKGNSIFFHCTGANTYTGGCIAISEEDMVTLLHQLDSNARIVIDYLPGN